MSIHGFIYIFAALVLESYAEKCFKCNGVPNMQDCNIVTDCGPGEKCYTRKLTQSTGIALFESGCISDQACNLLQGLGGIGRKRALTNCYECCATGTSNDPCNRHLCGDKIQTVQGFNECYQCKSVAKPEDCNHIAYCDRDELCYTHSYRHDNLLYNTTRYTLGCARSAVCRAYEALAATQVNDNSTYYCNRCCDKEFCNINLCGFVKLAKPAFTWKPNDRKVIPGVDREVTLICRTDPVSKATISWSFISESGSTTVPRNAHFSRAPNNVNVTLPIQVEDLGTWTCTATNSAGTSTATAKVENAHAQG